MVAGQPEVTLPYAYAETFAAGVRFRPTDEDLIFFLRLKHAGREIPVGFFKDFDVYQASPEAIKGQTRQPLDRSMQLAGKNEGID